MITDFGNKKSFYSIPKFVKKKEEKNQIRWTFKKREKDNVKFTKSQVGWLAHLNKQFV
jgi:hypothetical protein